MKLDPRIIVDSTHLTMAQYILQFGTEAKMTTHKLSLVSAFILLGSASALAQSAEAPAPTTPEPTSTTVATDTEGRALIGENLVYNPAVTPDDAGDAETLYVLNDGTIKDSGEWAADDSKACKASGGIEVPLPAGRMGCIRL